MRVLLVSRRWYPEVVGGGQISAHKMAQALVKAGIDVHALTFVTEGGRKDEIIDGVKITRLPIRKLKLFPRFSNLEWMYREMRLQTLKFVKEWKPDVIHALNGESVPSMAGVFRKTGIPFVATVNGPLLFCFPGEGTDRHGKNCIGCKGRQRYEETMLRWGKRGRLVAFLYWLYSYPHMANLARSVKTAKLLLPISNGFKKDLLRLGYRNERIRVVHNPIEVQSRVKSAVRKELSIPPTAKVLLYAGRVTENKGVQNVMDAMKDLPETYLVVVGKGEYAQPLQDKANALGIHARVRFTGFVPNDKLSPYYSIANIVLMAGTFYESLGRMLMEACTYGVPVIGTDIGGIPDVIEDGKNGFLLKSQDITELRDKIKAILDNPSLAKKMGAYGKAKMKKEFSPDAVVKELISAYNEAQHLR